MSADPEKNRAALRRFAEVIASFSHNTTTQQAHHPDFKNLVIDMMKSLCELEKNGDPLAAELLIGLRAWDQAERERKIKSSLEGLNSLFERKQIDKTQLQDAIDLDTAVVEYLEARIGGSNIFTAGLAMELASLKKTQLVDQHEPNGKPEGSASLPAG